MEAATATDTLAATFISKCPNQILVIEQPRTLRDNYGAKYGESPQKAVEFENEVFVADEKSAEKIGLPLNEIIAHIREHDLFNVSIFEDAIPEAQEPTVEAQVREIMAASKRDDVDAIAALLEGERNLHNRMAVIATAKAALEQIAGEEPAQD